MKSTVKKPLILYSVNTWLAYYISQQYYGEKHYVWCSTHFDPSTIPAIDNIVPPSSSPVEIYFELLKDIARGDLHSDKIEKNRKGILRGVKFKLKAGVINKAQARDIEEFVNGAVISNFDPLIFVIPYDGIRPKPKPVPIKQRANPLSPEFIIDRLPRKNFDIISLKSFGYI